MCSDCRPVSWPRYSSSYVFVHVAYNITYMIVEQLTLRLLCALSHRFFRSATATRDYFCFSCTCYLSLPHASLWKKITMAIVRNKIWLVNQCFQKVSRVSRVLDNYQRAVNSEKCLNFRQNGECRLERREGSFELF